MIRAHDEGPILTLDIVGVATMMESPAVQEAVALHLACGGRVVRLDLRDCTVMDSTFSGTLLSLKRELDPIGGELVLVSPSPRVLESLQDMGLEDFYGIASLERPSGPWREIGSVALGEREGHERQLRRLILEAHDELARLPGPSSRGFGNVAAQLHEEPGKCPPRSSRNM